MSSTREAYSARYETNPLTDEMRKRMEEARETVYWTDRRLVRVDRLRLLTDFGFPMYDVSYCIGTLCDGSPCRVSLPFAQLPKARWKTELVRWARRERVNAKQLGMFAAVSTLT